MNNIANKTFGFVASPITLPHNCKFQLISGSHMRKATCDEIHQIKEALSTDLLGIPSYLRQIYELRPTPQKDGSHSFHPAPKEEWRYYVVEFAKRATPSDVDIAISIEHISMLEPIRLHLPILFIENSMAHMHPLHATDSDFFQPKPFTSFHAYGIRETHRLIRATFPLHPEIRHAANVFFDLSGTDK